MYPSRSELQHSQNTVLNAGRFANARVSLCRVGDGQWIVKDFSPKAWIIKNTYGQWTLYRELKALQKLQGLRGVPQDAYRVDLYAIAFRYVPGRVLAKVVPGEYAPTYFPALEQLVHDMHARGIAHLDIRYMHNVIVCDDGSPALIDFQTAVSLPKHIKWLSRHLKRVDISGVYKHWLKRSPETLDVERRTKLERQNEVRKYWILTGYLGRRARNRKRKQKLKEANQRHENRT